jgi:hypothetical protein
VRVAELAAAVELTVAQAKMVVGHATTAVTMTASQYLILNIDLRV